jgi:FtsH-binding integral membrane protein
MNRDYVVGLLAIAVLTAPVLYVWFMVKYGYLQDAMTGLVGTLVFLGFITFALSIGMLLSKRGLRALDTVVYALLVTIYILLSAAMVYVMQTATTLDQMGVSLLMIFGLVSVITVSLLYGVRA